MHEMAICQALLEQVGVIARQHSGTVNRVRILVGPLSGVEPLLLERAYAFACVGTAAEGSELIINDAPVRVRCRGCGAESKSTANRLVCGACGEWRTDLASGDELMLLQVELSREIGAVTV